jgi:hypothetical protein
VFSSTGDDILTSWFVWDVWICPERPRDGLTVLERRSRDGYGGGGSAITTSQASTDSGGGVGDESGAAMDRLNGMEARFDQTNAAEGEKSCRLMEHTTQSNRT